MAVYRLQVSLFEGTENELHFGYSDMIETPSDALFAYRQIENDAFGLRKTNILKNGGKISLDQLEQEAIEEHGGDRVSLERAYMKMSSPVKGPSANSHYDEGQ